MFHCVREKKCFVIQKNLFIPLKSAEKLEYRTVFFSVFEHYKICKGTYVSARSRTSIDSYKVYPNWMKIYEEKPN